MKKIVTAVIFSASLLVISAVITFQYSRSWENALFINPLYRLPDESKVVALTFDDGPSKERTPALLEMLASNDVKATFFMLGENIDKHPDIARAVYDQGHLIGNHSYDHPRMIFKSPAFIGKQLSDTDRLIIAAGQSDVQYFRPPYSSKYIVLPLVLKAAGRTLVTGSYDPPSEYISPYNPEKVASEVIANVNPGAIIYLHDGKDSDAALFVESVEMIISGLRAQGYQFVRLDYVSQP